DGADREELIRQIAFDEPAPPRRLDRAIPRDLETVVLKAMARNPADRYATAGELADDLRAFLEDRPIRARRPSLAQRLGRWGRRHRGAMIGAVAVLAVAVVALAVGTGLIWREKGRVEEQRDHAERQRERAEKGEALAREEKKRADDAAEKATAAAAREAAQRRKAERLVRLGTSLNDSLIQLGANRLPRGEQVLGDEKATLLRVLEFYDEFTREAPEDSPQAKSDVADAYRRVAMIHTRLGQYPEAIDAIPRCVKRFDALRRCDPG